MNGGQAQACPPHLQPQHLSTWPRASGALRVCGCQDGRRNDTIERVFKEPELERLADNEMKREGLYFVPAVALQIITADMMSVSATSCH